MWQYFTTYNEALLCFCHFSWIDQTTVDFAHAPTTVIKLWYHCVWSYRYIFFSILKINMDINCTTGPGLFTTMMTSSNGNIFRVTGPLCGEFTGPGEFPAQRPVMPSFVFFDLRLNKRLSRQPWGWWCETPSWWLWRQGNDCYVFDGHNQIFGVATNISHSKIAPDKYRSSRQWQPLSKTNVWHAWPLIQSGSPMM